MSRGYAHGTFERTFRRGIAIAVVCLVMAPAHAATRGFALPSVGFYLIVDAMLGLLAERTRSIQPGIVVHTRWACRCSSRSSGRWTGGDARSARGPASHRSSPSG